MKIFLILGNLILSLFGTCHGNSQVSSLLATGTLADIRQALRRTPIENPGWVQLSTAVLEKSGQGPENIWEFALNDNKAILLDDPEESFYLPLFPAEAPPLRFDVLPKPLAQYAERYVRQGKFREAILVLQKIEEAEPHNLYLLMNLAALYEKEGHTEHALQRLELALKVAPDMIVEEQILRWQVRLQSQAQNSDRVLEILGILANLYQTRLKEVRQQAQGVSENVARVRLLEERLEMEARLATVQNAVGVTYFLRQGMVLSFDRFSTLDSRLPGVFAFTFNRNKVWLERRRYESALKSANAMLVNLQALSEQLRQRALQLIQDNRLEAGQNLAESANHFLAMAALLMTRRAEILFREKQYDQAMIALNDAIEKNREDAVSYYRKGQILSLQRQFSQALIAFRKVIEFTSPARKLHAMALLQIEDVFNEESKLVIASSDPILKKKDEYFQNLTVEEQERIFSLADSIALVRRWFRNGRFSEVVVELRKQYAAHKDVVEIPYWLARSYRELGQPILAEFFFDRALELNEDHTPSLIGKAWYLSTRGQFSKALEVIQKLRKVDMEGAGTHAAMGWYFFQRNQLDRAIAAYQKAISVEPTEGEHHYRLAICYFRVGSYAFAARKFEDSRLSGYPWTRADLFQGLALIRDGRPLDGERALLRAAHRGSDNPEIVAFARRLLSDMGKVNQSLTAMTLPSVLKPLAGYVERAQFRQAVDYQLERVASGETLGVIRDLQERLKADNQDSELRYLLGILHLLVDREEIAEDYLEDSVASFPFDFRSLNSLAEIAFRQGRIDQSIIYWDRVRRVSTVLPFADHLQPVIDTFHKALSLNPSDEWAAYSKALLLIHSRRDSEAMEVLEAFSLREDRRTPYGDRIQVLLAQIYYRLATVEEKPEFWPRALSLLSKANYPYLDVAARYQDGMKSLRPPLPRPAKEIVPLPDFYLDYTRKAASVDLVRNPPQPTYTSVSKSKGDILATWKRVDQVLSGGKPVAVISSYDKWLAGRTSSLERYLGATEVSRQEEIAKEWEEKSKGLYEEALVKAEKQIYSGQIPESMNTLQEALSYRPQTGDEAMAGILALLLLEGRYVDLERLLKIVDQFGDYSQFTTMLFAHINYQQGNFKVGLSLIQSLPEVIVIPRNRILRALFKVQAETARLATSDFQALLHLGLLLLVTGQHENAHKALAKAGEFRGLVPYRSEALMWWAVRARKRGPAKEAKDVMFQLSQVDPRDKFQNLAKDLDQFYTSYRFVSE